MAGTEEGHACRLRSECWLSATSCSTATRGGGRISAAAPVLVVQADRCEVRLGGAGAVAGLLRGLEAEVLLAGAVGDDAEGRIVRQLLDKGDQG